MNNLGNNSLAPGSGVPLALRKPQRKAPVTIIVGIVSKDAIILASDSQTTFGTVAQLDVEKITKLRFSDAVALVAQSGSAVHSGRAVEILEDLAKDQSLTDYRTVADLAQKAMRSLKDELRFQNGDCTMDWLHEHMLKNGTCCELMLAYFFDGKPYIYTIDLMMGIANRKTSHYAAIGCGSNLGNYLLAEHAKPNMESEFAAVTSIYVVENVKKHDAFCGGPTKIGAVRRPPKPNCHSWDVEIFTDEKIDGIAKRLELIDISTKEIRTAKIQESLQVIADETASRQPGTPAKIRE